MSMNLAQVRDLTAALFRTADTGDERAREQALWQLESAFGALLDEVDRPNHGNPGELVLNRQRVTKLLMEELDH